MVPAEKIYKSFMLILIILVGLIVILGGVLYFKNKKSAKSIEELQPSTTITPSFSAKQVIFEEVSGEECEKAIAGKWTPIALKGGNGEHLKDVYATTSDAVYYFGTVYRNGGTSCEKINGADSSTFTIFGRDPAFTEWYWAKDKTNVYYADKVARDADTKTFQVLDYSWGKDKNHVYYLGDQIEGIEGMDAATFQIFGNGKYAYDKNHVYQVGAYQPNSKTSGPEIIPDIDAATFVILQEQYLSGAGIYIKDKNGVFFDEGDLGTGLAKIKNADPSTFQVLGPCFLQHGIDAWYAKDKSYAYCGAEILEGADINSFEFVGELAYEPPLGPLGIAKDKQCVWSKGVKVLDSQGQCVNPSSCTSQIIDVANSANSYNQPWPCGVNPF